MEYGRNGEGKALYHPRTSDADPPLHRPRKTPAKESALRLRARVIQALRQFFIDRDYLEVETPHLIPAPAPEIHIEPIAAGEFFLHTSPELCMKRLLAAGHPRLFQICRCFRRGERGSLHLPEFTLLEWYAVDLDYLALMRECEDMLLFVCLRLGFGEAIPFQGKRLLLQRPWERVTVKEAFERYASMDLDEALRLDRFDEVLVTEIEPRLGAPRPSFLYDYPAQLAALARVKKEDPSVAERFELYLGHLEIANAFSELTDPVEQRARFEREREVRRKSGKPTYPLPEKFLSELYTMPECAGIALGVDRLVMLLADAADIAEVIAFSPEDL